MTKYPKTQGVAKDAVLKGWAGVVSRPPFQSPQRVVAARLVFGETPFMVDAAIIEKEAMQLSDAQRAVLAERLLESISPTSGELRTAWVEEASDRMRAYRDGGISAVDGPRAMEELQKRFAE